MVLSLLLALLVFFLAQLVELVHGMDHWVFNLFMACIILVHPLTLLVEVIHVKLNIFHSFNLAFNPTIWLVWTPRASYAASSFIYSTSVLARPPWLLF